MKKKSLLLLLCIFLLTLTACGQQPTDYSAWIPSKDLSEIAKEKEEKEIFIYRNEIDGSKYKDPSKLTEELLNGDISVVEDIYTNQLIKGACLDLSEDIASKRTVIYVSSSTGDDRNNGLSPEKAKKTLPQYTGMTTIAVLLKCGDIFQMDGMFGIDTEAILGCYGEGSRPILDFTKRIEDPFVRVRGSENVWAVDLSKSEFCGKSVKENINFGQLIIDGVCNWKRALPPETGNDPSDYVTYLEELNDNVWIPDPEHGVLYLFSEKDPNESEVRVAVAKHGLSIQNANNVIISDLEIYGAGGDALAIADSTNITVSNCFFQNVGGAQYNSLVKRRGNGIQVTGTVENVNIQYNFFDKVFACGYTNSGIEVTDYQNSVHVTNNIFRRCYTGIESVTDADCIAGSMDTVYDNNIIIDMCDITNPDYPVYIDNKAAIIDKNVVNKSYHYDNDYEFICSANITNQLNEGSLSFTNNVCWGSDRFLLRFNADYGYPAMTGTYVYENVDSDKVCLFDIRDNEAISTYVKTLANEELTEDITVYKFGKDEEHVYEIADEAKAHLTDCFKRMFLK